MEYFDEAVIAYIKAEGYLPGENLLEFIDKLSSATGTSFPPNTVFEEALTRLIRSGKLQITIRKGQFLHLRPTSI